MSRSIWATLGIAATRDRDAIRRAYATKLRVTNPEDDAEGFKTLRAAYEAALQRARSDFEPAAPAQAEAMVAAAAPEIADDDGEAPAIEIDPPTAPDLDLELLNARWRELAGAFERPGNPDPQLLSALLAAPAMERIALRAEVEAHVAQLIAENLPRSDGLVAPAIAQLGWSDIPALRANPAIRAILARNAEIHPAQIGHLRGAIRPVNQWKPGGLGGWVFGIFLALNLVRCSVQPSRNEPVPPPSTVIGSEAAQPSTPEDWFKDEQVTGIVGMPEQIDVTVNLVVDGNGSPTDCIAEGGNRSNFDKLSCKVMMSRARFKPSARASDAGLRPAQLSVVWVHSQRDPGTYQPRLALPADQMPPTAPDPVRRGAECPADPVGIPGSRRDPVPCSPEASWISTADFPEKPLLAAGSRSLAVHFDIGRDGFIANCRLDLPSGVDVVDTSLCRLLERRLHYLPGRDAEGRAQTWKSSFRWGWTVKTLDTPRPSLPPAQLPSADLKPSAAMDATLAVDCPSPTTPIVKKSTDAALLTADHPPGCP